MSPTRRAHFVVVLVVALVTAAILTNPSESHEASQPFRTACGHSPRVEHVVLRRGKLEPQRPSR